METCRSPKPASLIPNAKFKAVCVQNLSHGKATVFTNSKLTMEGIVSMAKDVPKP